MSVRTTVGATAFVWTLNGPHSHDTGQHVHPAFGGAVGGVSLAADHGSHGRDIDYLAVALGQHARRDNLRQQERGPEIDGLSLLPLFDRRLQYALNMNDARVVHKNVHRSEKLEGLAASGGRTLGGPRVSLDHQAPATFGGDGWPRHFQALGISAHDGEIGSGVGENRGDFRANAP